MGMDVMGKAPTTEQGEYFRNNVWWWRPLANFITERYPEIAAGCDHWQTNDGDGLDDTDAKKLAVAMLKDIDSGYVTAFADQYEARRKNLPTSPCPYCEGTGTRKDAVGIANGMDAKKWCNGCDGSGRQEHDDSHYPFSVENVRNFAKFVAASGGFEIW